MKRFSVLVGVIPTYNDRILITQRSETEGFLPGVWGLPCGKINFGEQLETAALRELHEETGLVGKVVRMVGHSMFLSQSRGDDVHNLQVNFLVALAMDGPVRLDRSSQDYRWISTRDFLSEGLDDFTVATISQAFP